jgi:hypothetical protein
LDYVVFVELVYMVLLLKKQRTAITSSGQKAEPTNSLVLKDNE